MLRGVCVRPQVAVLREGAIRVNGCLHRSGYAGIPPSGTTGFPKLVVIRPVNATKRLHGTLEARLPVATAHVAPNSAGQELAARAS